MEFLIFKITGVVRPNVVFFGESLPQRFWSHLDQDFQQCDCLIITGTSLAVSPFNGLIAKPKSGTTRVFINKTKPGSVGFTGWIMGMGRSSVSLNGLNDLVQLDDCDKTVEQICTIAGWGEELRDMPIQILEP